YGQSFARPRLRFAGFGHSLRGGGSAVPAPVRREALMRDIFTIAILFSTIRLATPLVLAALGGMLSERSGVINIALEGLMLAGAFTSATVTHYSGSPWIGLLAGMATGVFVASIHAVACIKFDSNQVVTGTAINI